MSNLIGDAIVEAREFARFSQKELADLLQINVNTLGAYERKERLPDIDFLIKFCEETSADFNGLLELRIQSSPVFSNLDKDAATKYLFDLAVKDLQLVARFEDMGLDIDLNEQAGKLTVNQKNKNKHEQIDTIYIEHYIDVKGSAGPGQMTPTDQTIIQVAVNAVEWRNYVGLDHKHVKIITIHGDSMRPTFCHGDQVLVDTACHSFIDDGVYAIQQGDLLRVKRIKLKLDGSIEVKSDNTQGFSTDVHTKEEAADFKIYGRVIPFKFGKIEL